MIFIATCRISRIEVVLNFFGLHQKFQGCLQSVLVFFSRGFHTASASNHKRYHVIMIIIIII